MEIIKGNVKIIDEIVSIELEEDIEDNCQYEIRLKDFKSIDGKSVLDSYTHRVVTKLSPSYCTLSDVIVLVDTFKIPESTVLYYIREASKHCDYIVSVAGAVSSSGGNNTVTFPMKQFVKTKTMIDCLLQAYANKAAGSGIKGTLGVISFENTEKYATSIDDLLDDLRAELKKWEDALKGYELEGRAKPVYSIKASKTSEATTFNEIADSMTRELPIV